MLVVPQLDHDHFLANTYQFMLHLYLTIPRYIVHYIECVVK